MQANHVDLHVAKVAQSHRVVSVYANTHVPADHILCTVYLWYITSHT